MLKGKNNQLSIYSILYNKIPENHTLKLINKAIDLSFVTKLLEVSYNKYYGRPAKDPELMIRLLILQYLYNLSDEKLIEECSLNLAFMWFLGINPDDDLPDSSLLSKFRVHRLNDITLDQIITEIVRQCIEKGIIKDTGISIDATHTEANTFKATPERVIKHLAKKIFKTYEEESGELPKNIDKDIPDYKQIENHKEAKKTMKDYLEKEIEKVENIVNQEENPKTIKVLENAKEILKDPKFIEQRGVRSIVDQEARVGHKSKTERFFGYKTEFMMTTDERIITAVTVKSGEYVDGTNFDKLIELTNQTGLKVEEVFGDKAYFRKPILDKIKEIEAKAYIPISEMSYKIDEEIFSYNKDSDEWFCSQGNITIRKKHRKDKSGKETYKYYFEKEKCRNCSKREECKTGKNIGKILEVGINTPEFYGYSQEQKTDGFKEKYKKRACHEGKNGEMKNHHGLNRARGYGLRSMSTQAKLTAIAVNLKRIASILSSKFSFIMKFFRFKLVFY
ncbi:IS1182 family transposase [Anaerosalibacter sp. Marseille-P3206]|uniref:IS1182 family transposase n=1 Tax=Anaerosalibacter sp. Marseille-P3206 TaxID=1871005 RepID=UPI0009863CF6|nr:IS1182 family transposase [Anaerosalibacter sp. Marseille-P3206]